MQDQACHVLEVVQGKLVLQHPHHEQDGATFQNEDYSKQSLVLWIKVDEVECQCKHAVAKVAEIEALFRLVAEVPNALH